jgi:hypothetical protein
VTSAVPVDDESQRGGVLLSATKLYIVIGCIAALVLIAVIQAGCTIYKTVRNPSSYHKVSSMLTALFFFEFHSELLCSHLVHFMPMCVFSLCKTDHITRHCTVSVAPNVVSHKSVIPTASGNGSPTA